MKYSIIIPYRDREWHLQTNLPVLQEKFKDKDYEIIVCEQDDKEIFKKMALLNASIQQSSGDMLIFHDVDYVPSDNVDYFSNDENTPMFPVRQVIFLDENNQERPEEEIPGGYRYFKYDGGVFIISRLILNKINGFNPRYVGWGCNDMDIHARVISYGYTWKRNKDGLFYALYHPNSEPPADDIDELRNREILNDRAASLKRGINDFSYTHTIFDTEMKNVKWMKVKDIKIYE
jgi:predicted glycosyltransferase involved in capsule biosynthesis